MSKEFKHTPGEWTVIDAQHGFIIEALDSAYDVAVVRNIGNQDNQANAHLIAAAPDLLATLLNLLEVHGQEDRLLCCDGRECGCMGATVHQEAEHLARSAIAKATRATQ